MANQTLSNRMAAVEGALKALTSAVSEIQATLRLANGGKKHYRIEALALFVAVMVMLQSIGLLDGIKAAINQWMSGG